MELPKKILIVGAGPVGLTLAIMLAMNKVPCRIIDKRTRSTKLLRAIAISKETESIFSSISVLDSINECALFVDKMVVHHVLYGRLELNYQGLNIDNKLFTHVYQPDIERVLESRLNQLGIEVDYNKELVDLNNSDCFVQAIIKDHLGNNESDNYLYLIGCDGGKSKVRDLSGIRTIEESYEHYFLLADVIFEGNFTLNSVNWYVNDNGYFVIIPGPQKRFRLIFSSKSDEKTELSASYLESLIFNVTKDNVSIKEIIWKTSSCFRHNLATEGRRKCVFLAGDAYHIFSPIGGVNLNFGLQDASSLAWRLARVVKGQASDSLLHEYSIERNVKIEESLTYTRFLTNIMTMPKKNRKVWKLLMRKLHYDPNFKRALIMKLTGFPDHTLNRLIAESNTLIEHSHLCSEA